VSIGLLKLNKLHLAKRVRGPRLRELHSILKRVVTSCVEKPRRITAIANDELVNDVFDLGAIFASDSNEVNTVTKEFFDQHIQRWQVPLRTAKNDTFAVGHF
jgi:hypothetical protein